jgi:hypothetical protein
LCIKNIKSQIEMFKGVLTDRQTFPEKYGA